MKVILFMKVVLILSLLCEKYGKLFFKQINLRVALKVFPPIYQAMLSKAYDMAIEGSSQYFFFFTGSRLTVV